jgi:hypothetical protein
LHRVIIAVSIASLASGACAGGPDDDVLDIVYDPCTGFRFVPASDATPEQLTAIADGAALWHRVLATVEAGDLAVPEPTIPIRFEDAAPAFRGIYLDETGEVVINRGLELDRMTITIAHELGHAFGLWHVDDRVSVMNEGNITVVPDAADADAVVALWPSCRM